MANLQYPNIDSAYSYKLGLLFDSKTMDCAEISAIETYLLRRLNLLKNYPMPLLNNFGSVGYLLAQRVAQ